MDGRELGFALTGADSSSSELAEDGSWLSSEEDDEGELSMSIDSVDTAAVMAVVSGPIVGAGTEPEAFPGSPSSAGPLSMTFFGDFFKYKPAVPKVFDIKFSL